MKKNSIILFFLGLSLIIAGAAWIGADSILKSVFSIGLDRLLILCIWQLLIIVVLSWAWHCICPELGVGRLFWARNLREAAATCLPFSQIGGIVLGVRAVCFKGYRYLKNPPNLSAAQGISSNIVDITTETLGQVVFIITGITILLVGGYHTQLQDIHLLGVQINLKWFIIFGVLLLIFGLIPFIWTQRQGNLFFRKIVNGLSSNIAQQWSGKIVSSADSLQEALDQIWAHPKRIIYSCTIHFIGWVGSGIGTWMCYHFIGADITLLEAITIEALVCVVISIGFLVPASVGIQEGAYVIIGTIFGVDPSLSFVLSILRRARDLIIGIPILLLWQLGEIRYLRKNPQKDTNLNITSN
ncbi:lysylphosphatidylglycerol synthase domain-containing protein [Commensalibacter nepenthis]|uniref:Lysylphosphatidylglycerol synthase domain-containing protein n=1 Tax=Commensalibacter nepenthis TaxID=3043872 RepID=A0ABT6Q829_9PROT|nr:lysylphosphatidylglycerol synthase domain-containing protein [Commensalibacter sp. TBRC 10068]MDI2112936.1 lysylphosphatidylglycerol synthase domain-containing protein [Commensalibacter sp. TBRC 10068]